jgi:hypothetical protein
MITKIIYIVGTAMPVSALGSGTDESVFEDGYAYASTFAGNFSFLLSIIIGLIAVIFVFRSAGKMGGGLFGTVLKYVGVGMVFALLGTLTTFFVSWVPGFWLSVGNTVSFSMAYIFMAIGANKLLKGIMKN